MALASCALLAGAGTALISPAAVEAAFENTYCAIPIVGPNSDVNPLCEAACATEIPLSDAEKALPSAGHWYTTNCRYHVSKYSELACDTDTDPATACTATSITTDAADVGEWAACEDKSYCWRDYDMGFMTDDKTRDPKTGTFAALVANWEDSADSAEPVNKKDSSSTKYPSCFTGKAPHKYNGDGKGVRPCAVESWNWNAAGRASAPATAIALLVAAAGAVLAFGQL